MKCARCCDTYWVCETHDDRPWDGEHACGCGAPGAKANPGRPMLALAKGKAAIGDADVGVG
jgi:hypothetical protein